MRLLSAFALALLPIVSLAEWHVNAKHSLIWNGLPYLPIGVRVSGDPEAIGKVNEAGIKDVIVELPASGETWDAAFAALDKAGMRYMVAINSLAAAPEGYIVKPQGYRLSQITEAKTLETNIPGAKSALVILAARDGSVVDSQRKQTPEGRLTASVNPLNTTEHTILIYPEAASLEIPDFWEGFDTQRDNLIYNFKRHPAGPGFRGVINPMGSLLKLPSQKLQFVPGGKLFRLEFANYLADRYKTLETAEKSWAMSRDVGSWENLVKLVPLWSGSRGVANYWDTSNDQLYASDSHRSLFWTDLQDYMNVMARRRFSAMVRSIRQVAQVPVIEDWRGWAATYEGLPTADGMGAVCSGTSPSELLGQSSRALSTVVRWNGGGWVPATSISFTEGANPGNEAAAAIDTLGNFGIRGWFFRAQTPEQLKAVAALSANASALLGMEDQFPSPVFFPESALGAAQPQLLPGGFIWLPSPADGNRLDFGSGYNAYRMIQDDSEQYVFWTDRTPLLTKFKVDEPAGVKVLSLYGPDPGLRIHKKDFELMVGNSPLIFRGLGAVPVPDKAFQDAVSRYANLIAYSQAVQKSASEDTFEFNNSLKIYEASPGAAMNGLRKQYLKMLQRLARYSWIEAEGSRSHNFGEVADEWGSSGGRILNLDAQLEIANQVYFADYDLTVRTDQVQELWIAARISPENRKKVTVMIGGEHYFISDPPVGNYGLGFSWYKLGETRLGGNRTKLRVEIDGSKGAELALDTILLFPGNFKPNGAFMPDVQRSDLR